MAGFFANLTPLFAAMMSGAFLGERANSDGTVTTSWRVSYPINPYLLTLNVAPYVAIEERYPGADGMKTVYAWFRDIYGNTSASAAALIIRSLMLTRPPPSPSGSAALSRSRSLSSSVTSASAVR